MRLSVFDWRQVRRVPHHKVCFGEQGSVEVANVGFADATSIAVRGEGVPRGRDRVGVDVASAHVPTVSGHLEHDSAAADAHFKDGTPMPSALFGEPSGQKVGVLSWWVDRVRNDEVPRAIFCVNPTGLRRGSFKPNPFGLSIVRGKGGVHAVHAAHHRCYTSGCCGGIYHREATESDTRNLHKGRSGRTLAQDAHWACSLAR